MLDSDEDPRYNSPTGSISLPESNATIQTNRRGRGHGYFYGQGRGCSRGRHISWNQGDYNQPHNKKNNSITRS